MEWTAQIDAYCERLAPGLWAEPLNAVTNLAFVLAAAWMWHRLRGQQLLLARVLTAVLALVGLASGAWHTLAQGWAGAADSGSIALFIVIYLFGAHRHYWNMAPAMSVLCTALTVPLLIASTWILNWLPFLEISALYWSVALLIAGHAAALHGRTPATSRRLALGAAILALSIALRSLDDAACAALPFGTHFLWHLLNAAMLGWMIETLRRHVASAT